MSISRFVELTFVQSCFALVAVPLLAQTARPPADACADTLSVPYRERLAIDLIYDGENRREMWQAIQLAGTTRTQCVVAKSAVPTADTSTYGVLRINALENGGYETRTGGKLVALRSTFRAPACSVQRQRTDGPNTRPAPPRARTLQLGRESRRATLVGAEWRPHVHRGIEGGRRARAVQGDIGRTRQAGGHTSFLCQ